MADRRTKYAAIVAGAERSGKAAFIGPEPVPQPFIPTDADLALLARPEPLPHAEIRMDAALHGTGWHVFTDDTRSTCGRLDYGASIGDASCTWEAVRVACLLSPAMPPMCAACDWSVVPRAPDIAA